jgi:hypothetical protein
MEDTILQNKNTIKNIIKSKFKEKMWHNKELEEKQKLRYYRDVVVSPRPSPVTDHVICKRIVNMFYRLVSQVLNKL